MDIRPDVMLVPSASAVLPADTAPGSPAKSSQRG
jgi:hypothetical protein